MTALHSWQIPIDRARHVQTCLREYVQHEPLGDIDALETVAGADISYNRGSDRLYAAVVVLETDSLEIVDVGVAHMEVSFPYVPGLLSFREGPPLLRAFARLTDRPDLLVCDGHGLAHPRRFGLACHIGLWLDLPTVGVAKNILVGEPADHLNKTKGSTIPLRDSTNDDGETDIEDIGAVLRTRTDVNPVYVSVGHKTTIDDAIHAILEISPTYKIPEPIRQAHHRVNELRAEGEET